MTMTQGTNVRSSCEQVAYSLDELVECISEHMPAKESEGFEPPGAIVQNAWRTLVQDLVAIADISECDAISVPSALGGIYEVFPFYDVFDGRDYCVAMEVEDFDGDSVVDRGWGTLIVNPTPERYLSIDIPHPIEDKHTNIEGIAIFKGVGAHTFVMAGSNRRANAQESSCQSGEVESDVAHAIDNLFFPTVVEIDQHYSSAALEHTAIQFHGMTSDGCPDVAIYLTHGSKLEPQSSDSIVALRDALLAIKPEWGAPGAQTVAVPEQPGASCSKNGRKNVEGRYLNTGSESAACGSNAKTYNGRFIHVEQDPDSDLVEYRNPLIWIEALENVFAPVVAPPSTTTMSFQDGVAPSSAYAGTSDTWFHASKPNEKQGANVTCEADDDKSAALRWDLSAIPAGSTIDEVRITLDVVNATDSRGFYAYPLSRDWSEAHATWNDYDDALPWQAPGAKGALDREAIPVGKSTARTTGEHTFLVNPALVQSWIDDPSSNHGILIANEANSNGVDFSCKEASIAAERPRLTVVYH
ncbi:MAG: DNRLRE domain-containing protein [Enhygromyxa sp.]